MPTEPSTCAARSRAGIKALRLFLEVNALQLQGIDAFDGLVIGLARHPAEGLVRAAVRQHDVVVITRDARDERNRGGKIFDFGGHGERGIHQHRHGQLVARAVVDDAALGGQRDGTLLLVSGLLDELAVAEDLQEDQAAADDDAPEKKHGAEQVEPGVFAGMRMGRRHVPTSDKHGGPPVRPTAR